MTGLISAIAVAVIGGPIMWLLTRLDRRNSEQHAENGQVLERIETKLDNHVNNPKGHR